MNTKTSRFRLIGSVLTVALLALGSPAAMAQNVTNTTINASGGTTTTVGPQSFFQSVGGYLTSIDYDYSFTNVTFEASLGAGQSGPILANYVKGQYDLGRWDISTTIRNAGIGGVIQSAQLGGGYKVVEAGDTALTVACEGGYDFAKSAGLMEPEIFVRKKMTANTFLETGVSLPEWTKGGLNKTPGFFVGTGFTY